MNLPSCTVMRNTITFYRLQLRQSFRSFISHSHFSNLTSNVLRRSSQVVPEQRLQLLVEDRTMHSRPHCSHHCPHHRHGSNELQRQLRRTCHVTASHDTWAASMRQGSLISEEPPNDYPLNVSHCARVMTGAVHAAPAGHWARAYNARGH